MDELLATRVPRSLPIMNVLDNVHPCSYLSERTATLPLILPGRRIAMSEFDHMLSHGLRRSGYFTYFTACENCCACEPSRIEVQQFRWSDSWRRILNRGDRSIEMTVSEPEYSDEKLLLFNGHRTHRDLGHGDGEYHRSDYEGFLVDSCCESTIEVQFCIDGQLVAVSIVDCGEQSLSAVYTYFDPRFGKLSLGSYAILKLLQLAMQTERKYVYLGMYVGENRHLSYKARFTPQERLVNGQWILFP